MTGLVLASVSGVCFSLSNVLVRRGVYRSDESFSAVVIAAFLGFIFFGLTILVSGQAEQLTSLSWLGVGLLAGVGLMHFVIGRMAAFVALRLIGVTRAIPILVCNILVTALLGIILLGEPLTTSLVLALLLIVGGVILAGTTGDSDKGRLNVSRASLLIGIFSALGAALLWGVSPVLIKMAIKEVSSPLVAAFVSYTAAFIVSGSLLIHPGNNDKLRSLNRASLVPLILGGIAVSVAQLLRYLSLYYSPASAVAPVSAGVNYITVFLLSFLMNREIEVFNLKIIMGAIAAAVGVCLIFWGA